MNTTPTTVKGHMQVEKMSRLGFRLGGAHRGEQPQRDQVLPVEFFPLRLRQPRGRQRPLHRVRRCVLHTQVARLVAPMLQRHNSVSVLLILVLLLQHFPRGLHQGACLQSEYAGLHRRPSDTVKCDATNDARHVVVLKFLSCMLTWSRAVLWRPPPG
jgi:hypothetical protein